MIRVQDQINHTKSFISNSLNFETKIKIVELKSSTQLNICSTQAKIVQTYEREHSFTLFFEATNIIALS